MARSIDDVIDEAGWTEPQVIALLLQFVQSKRLNRNLREWLLERSLDEARSKKGIR